MCSNIKKWAADDRPREKLIRKGKSVLSDTELLAVIIGSGTKTKTAVALAMEIMSYVTQDLNKLSTMEIKELCMFKGIGPVKAVNIIASIELAKRRELVKMEDFSTIKTSWDGYKIMKSEFQDIHYEAFWVLCLNRANKVISKKKISEGGLDSTVVDPKRVFKITLMENACSIILCHNHPSGQLSPSKADIGLTKKLSDAGKVLDISVLDHLIFAGEGYFSFADSGIMP